MASHPNRSAGNPARNPSPAEVRAAREAAGLTQAQAAALVYASLRNWQQWEQAEGGVERQTHAPGDMGAVQEEDGGDAVMDIELLEKEKQQLENDMTVAVSLLVDQFHEKCGISPSSIYVSIVAVQQMREPRPRHIVSDVSVTISI